ncbi:MAG: cell division protein ZapA [Acidobacteriota bacterium]|nr:cell division protein ZapA [Acidobacteriota bacterium]MDH3783866.1 cell division protein ZapA [Acidobacteriota bacterium]
MSEPPAKATPVTILGTTYHLRGHEDEEYLLQLARLVDGKMREVASATGTADSMKIAILGCLNLADDYIRASRDGGSASGNPDKDHERRLTRMVTLLDEALAE